MFKQADMGKSKKRSRSASRDRRKISKRLKLLEEIVLSREVKTREKNKRARKSNLRSPGSGVSRKRASKDSPTRSPGRNTSEASSSEGQYSERSSPEASVNTPVSKTHYRTRSSSSVSPGP